MHYNPALTGLRAVAIVAVDMHHCMVPGFNGGFLGVDLFFVLSGFLITSILQKEYEQTGSIDFLRFLWRRLLRLAPALYLVLTVALVIDYASPIAVGISAAYLGNVFRDHVAGLGYTWSLAVEAQFYLLWPLLLAPILRSRNPTAWVIGLFLFATFWRVVLMTMLPMEVVYYRLDARLTGLLLGSALAVGALSISSRDDRVRVAKLSAYALALCCVTVFPHTISGIGAITVAEIGAAGLLLAALDSTSTTYRILSHPWMVRIGLWSYSLYLWHYPVGSMIARANY
jgi:peptidoglycan/LPS O-acetylase OafA/YrhL